MYQMLGFEAVMPSFGDRQAAIAALGADPAARSADPAPDSAARLLAPLAPPGLVAAGLGSAPLLAPEDAIDADGALRIEVGLAGEESPVTIVSLHGVLDTVTSLRLSRVLASVREAGTRRVLADLSRLEYASSAGWGVLTSEVAALRGVGGDLRIFGMSGRLEHVFELLNLRAVLRSFDVFADAVASFAATVDSGAAAVPEAPAEATAPCRTPAAATVAPISALPSAAAVSGEAAALRCGTFSACLEPFGRSGGAEWLRLEGHWDEAATAVLEPWLAGRAASPLLLVDAGALESVEPEAWAALRRHAESVEIQGGAVRVVGARAGLAPTRDLGLPVHLSVTAALRAHQRHRAPQLGQVRLADGEFNRDAEVRREGWTAYLELLREAAKEDAL